MKSHGRALGTALVIAVVGGILAGCEAGGGAAGTVPGPSGVDIVAPRYDTVRPDVPPTGGTDLAAPVCTTDEECAAKLAPLPACTTGVCDAATRGCRTAPVADGAACDDGDECTSEDHCAASACAGTPIAFCGVDCQVDGDCAGRVPGLGVCQRAVCRSGTCAAGEAASASPCDDGQRCTEDDACQMGQCMGRAIAGCVESCQPNCVGKECGDDGCGTTCGTCPDNHACLDFQCECRRSCTGRVCGNDGCGGTCGTCPFGSMCDASGQCEDGCGALPSAGCCEGSTLRVCQGGELRAVDCAENPAPNDECGWDAFTGIYRCGGSGADPSGESAYGCPGCVPQCEGLACGPDGCGGECGPCPVGEECAGTVCVACTPRCAGQECGDDGCGGSCGTCDAGTSCNADGECEALAGACLAQAELACNSFVTGTTIGGTTSVDSYSCVGWNESGPERAYRLVVPAGGPVTIALDALSGGDLDLFVLTGTCAGTACVYYGDDGVSFTAAAGTTYYVVVDGYSGEEDDFALDVACESACVPQCGGRECGTDGCDGSCGTCGADETCVDGACESTSTCSDDAAEPDDTAALATTLTAGVTRTHSICPASDVDWWRFTLASSADVVVETSGASGDTRLWLYDVSEVQVGYDDDGGEGNLSRLQKTALAAGTYYVKVDEYQNDDELSTYGILLTVSGTCAPSCAGRECGSDGCGGTCGTCGAGETCDASGQCSADCVRDAGEPDDDATSARTLPPGTAQARSICPIGDTDWWTFTLASTADIVLETSGDAGADTQLWVYDTAGTTVGSDDDGGEGSYSRYARAQLAAGTYRVKVAEFGSNALLANYALLLTVTGACVPTCDAKVCGDDGCGGTCGACPDGATCNTSGRCLAASGCQLDLFEPDEDGAAIVFAGEPQDRSMCPAGDVDWFAFELGTTADVTLTTSGTSGDTRMWLYDESQTQLAYDDDGGDGTFSLLTRTALAPGTYFVKVDEYHGSELAAYRLSLTIPCGLVEFTGCCADSMVTWCESGSLRSIDCGRNTAPLDTCGWTDGAGYDCGGTGGDPAGQFPITCP